MGSLIGQTLPLAVGIAVSPVPIIAAILMLLSPKARTSSVGYAVGWVVGIVVAVTVLTLVSSAIPGGHGEGPAPVRGVIQIVLGLLLFVVAVRQWRKRPVAGREPTMPRWMQAVDTMGFGKALGLGFLLAAVNPKNLLLSAGAGVTIGSAGAPVPTAVVAIIVFIIVAASTVLTPVLAYLVAAQRMGGALDATRVWLLRENAVIMAVLMLVMGVVMIGKGIGSF